MYGNHHNSTKNLFTGDICKVVDYLKDRLSKANKKLNNKENVMDSANPYVWSNCQGQWQDLRSLIYRYQSGLVKLIYGAIQSVDQFHNYELLHLDVKGLLHLCFRNACSTGTYFLFYNSILN